MTPRRRALLIVGLALVLIGLIVFAVVMLIRSLPKKQAPAAPGTTSGQASEPAAAAEFVNPLIVEAPPAPASTFSLTIAVLFAERYGSYSNQGDYQNIRDLLRVMTPRYRKESEDFLRTAPAADPGTAFEGVTSKRISTQIRSISDTKAVIAVSMQQEKTVGTAAPVIGYRTLRMELLKLGGDWWVDSASWEN